MDITIREFVTELLSSTDVKLRWLGQDLHDLLGLLAAPWRGRMQVLSVARTPRRSVRLSFTLVVKAHVQAEQQDMPTVSMGPHDFEMEILPSYPLTVPLLTALGPLWNQHIMDKRGLRAKLEAMPPELRRLAELGRGSVCAVRKAEWSAIEPQRCNIAAVIWHLSRILVLDPKVIHGEFQSLNAAARELASSLKDEDGNPLALGEALPRPHSFIARGSGCAPAGQEVL